MSAILWPQLGLAVGGAELYTSKAYGYGRFETRTRFAFGDGVVSSFFLWKDGSEKAGTFWNELDFEKLGADCYMQTNPIFGNPPGDHGKKHALQADLCGAYHTYTYEWTPEAIVWLVDGAEIRRETDATALAFAQNASAGMQIHFNVWPGDATFGGNFKPSILPVHQYIDWVQFSAYQDGAFTLAWREDFNAATVPAGWLTGNWSSPKNLSTHDPENVNFIDGFAVLSLTADDALGPAGAMPEGASGGSNSQATAGSGNASGATGVGGAPASAGSTSSGAGASTGGSATSAAGAASTSGGAASAAGAVNGSPAMTAGNTTCNFGPSPDKPAFWWTLIVPALAFLRRRARHHGAT